MSYSTKLNSIFKDSWHSPAIQAETLSLNYQEFYIHANAVSEYLKSLSYKPGDSIAINLSNGPEYCIAYLACILGNYIIVPVNIELTEEDQDYIIKTTNPVFVINKEFNFFELEFEEFIKPAFQDSKLEYDAIFFTSGTTGMPKGVCHSLDSLVENVTSFNKNMSLKDNVRMYHVLPMAYMAGFLNTILSPLIAGGCILVGPRFNPSNALVFWDKAIKWNANSIWLTPTLAAILIKFTRDQAVKDKIKISMDNIFCGTAPLSQSLRVNFLKTFSQPLQESFGMSEILLVSSQTRAEASKESNVGSILPELLVTKRMLDGQEELLIKSPWSLKCYLIEGKTSSPLINDGFMPTGDIGEINKKKLSITGRIKDLIIRGGVNIMPASIENIIQSIPGVDDVAVVGLPHEFWGEQICVCVVINHKNDKDGALQDIKIIVNKKITNNMRPDKYIILDEIPKNTNGKTLKNDLVARLK